MPYQPGQTATHGVREIYESFCRGSSNFKGRTGPNGFSEMMRAELGLVTDVYGRQKMVQTLENGAPRLRADDPRFNFGRLAEDIIGSNFNHTIAQALNPAARFAMESEAFVRRAQQPSRGALESEAVGAIQPSAFLNISAWNSTIAGLIEAKVLEGFTDVAFVGEQLFTIKPTNLRQEKLIGVGRIPDDAEVMNPGENHPRTQFTERFVKTPETQKRGLAIDVTWEANFFDLTGQVLARAEGIGYSLGMNREKRMLDVVCGATNEYDYGDTTYNTYLTSGNWINDAANELDDWTDVDNAMTLYSELTDQETSEPVYIRPTALLCSPAKEMTARKILTDTMVQIRTQSQGYVSEGRNPLPPLDLIVSTYLPKRIADNSLATSTQAREWWFLGDFPKAFIYTENKPLTIRRAMANDYLSLDADLALSIFADEMGAAGVQEPRYTNRNKHSGG